MRAGWNAELQKRLHRADPGAYPIVEVVAVTDEDVRSAKTDWEDADATTGFDLRADGTLALEGTVGSLSEQATHDAFTTDLRKVDESTLAAQTDTVWIRWFGGTDIVDPNTTVSRLRLYLDPDIAGTGVTASFWRMQMYEVVSRWVDTSTGTTAYMELSPLGGVQTVAIAGSGEGYVTFDLTGWTHPYRPGTQRRVALKNQNGGATGNAPPETVCFVYAVTNTGTTDDNVGLGYDSANMIVEDAVGHVTYRSARLYPKEVTKAGETRTLYAYGTTDQKGAPRVDIETGTYAQATISFTGAGNRLRLASAPASDTTLELAVRGVEPDGAAIDAEVSADGVTWYPFVDGDRIGEDRTADGGSDLSAVARRQDYYWRVTLDPAGTVASPVLHEVALRELTLYSLEGLFAAPESRWAVDPVEMKGNVPELSVEVMRDGRADRRDRISQILSAHDPADLAIRVFVGAYDLARRYWLHVDTFALDDFEPADQSVVLKGISAISKLDTILPRYDSSTRERAPIEYVNWPLADVFEDLLAGQAALDARYRGPAPTSTQVVTKTIGNETQAKGQLDQVALLAGGALVSSQGRVKFVDFFDTDSAPVAILEPLETEPVYTAPGLKHRAPEFFVPYAWNTAKGDFDSEFRSVDAVALAAVGANGSETNRQLDADTARWITEPEHAEAVGRRRTETIGGGLILWGFHSIRPFPFLEPGDPVVVATDRFIAHDPISGREIRGAVWARAIVAASDVMGQELEVWVRGYRDIFVTGVSLDRIDLGLDFDDFRETARSTTSITVASDVTPRVAEVWVWEKLVAQPFATDPWDDVLAEDQAIYDTFPFTHTLAVPPEGFVRLAHFQCFSEALEPGEIIRLQIDPIPTAPPILRTKSKETATTVTHWLQTIEQGAGIATVEIITREGSAAWSDPTTPIRGEGDASTVWGGLLGPGEYEHDITLAGDRTVAAQFLATLDNGEVVTTEHLISDRGLEPTFQNVYWNPATRQLTVTCDTDTKSIVIEAADGGAALDFSTDGAFKVFDLSAAIADSEERVVRITAQSDPLADVDGDTLIAELLVTLTADAFVPGTKVRWASVALAAPTSGQNVTATLDADGTLAGTEVVKVYRKVKIGSGAFSAWSTDIASAFSPSLAAAPPTSSSAHTHPSGYAKVAKGTAGAVEVTMRYRFDIEDGSGNVLDTEEVERGWLGSEI